MIVLKNIQMLLWKNMIVILDRISIKEYILLTECIPFVIESNFTGCIIEMLW